MKRRGPYIKLQLHFDGQNKSYNLPFWLLCLLFCPLVCVYLNKYGKVGPHLDQQRIQQLPDHFGPGRASSVLQQCVQACVDSAHNQGTVFSCLKSGQGGEVISGGDILYIGLHFFIRQREGHSQSIN